MLRWPSATLYEGLADVAEAHPSQSALVFDGAEITYEELVSRSRRLAGGLSDIGVSTGDTIAVWLGNRPEWIVAQLAASFLGATVVAVNTRYRRHELEHMLEDSGARAILTESSFLGTDYLETLAEVVPQVGTAESDAFDPDRLPALDTVISLDPDDRYPAVRAYDDLANAEPRSDELAPATDHERPVVVFYTSGTTGDPKGCLHDSRSVLNHSYAIGEHFDVGPDDVGLTTLPFCGIMGYNYVLSLLTRGATAVVQPHFDPERAAENVATHGVTYLSGTAAMCTRLIDAEGFDPAVAEPLAKGAVFFANGFEESTFEHVEASLGYPIVQPYGSSEANSQVFLGDPADPQRRRKRVGGPLLHPEEESARIVDPDSGEELPPGERGELQLRGYNVLRAYLGRPEKTDAEFVDGWLRTGDLCSRDEDDYFYYHSRIDDALRVRGFLVSPREIETAIDGHPSVEQSQVVGAPHPRHGEVPVGFVTASGVVDEDDVLSYLEGRIADYKLPEAIVPLEAFPRTEGPHGEKIQKTELRDRVAERFADGEAKDGDGSGD